MGYRVEYGGPLPGKAHRRGLRAAALTAVFLLLFLLLVGRFWPQGARALRQVLLPGDPAVTAAALEELARELKGGQGLRQALEAFCRTVLREAGLGA